MSRLLNSKRNPFESLFIPNRVIVDMNYPNYSIDEKKLDKVRFVFSPVSNPIKPFVLLVIAHDSISPIQYPYETFFLIRTFLSHYSIDIKDVEIILDYYQRTGIEENNISGWEFTTDRKGEYLEDRLTLVEEHILEKVLEIRKDYYNEFNQRRN